MCHVTLNKNAVVGDLSAMNPGGVRIGTPAMTSRGLKEEDFTKIADFLHEVVQVSVWMCEQGLFAAGLGSDGGSWFLEHAVNTAMDVWKLLLDWCGNWYAFRCEPRHRCFGPKLFTKHAEMSFCAVRMPDVPGGAGNQWPDAQGLHQGPGRQP
eukprot:146610-Pelagomonas_calceolata.AAC.3